MIRVTNPSASRPAEPILTIQCLRGIAAVLVVFAHAIDYQQNFLPGHCSLTSFFYLENFGAVGADIFFVVSGFIMAIAAPDAAGNGVAARFALKRLIRIVPIYWLLTIITALLADPHFVTLPRLIASFTFVPLYPHGQFLPPIILVGWSLSFELYFYMLIAFALTLRGRGQVVPGVACVLTILAITGMILTPYGSIAAFLLNPLLAEFALGAVIGCLYRRRQADLSLSIAMALVACGLCLLLGTLVVGFGAISEVQDTLMGDAAARRLVMWGLPSALAVAGCVFSERRLRNRMPPILLLLGDASYSIYLLQLIALKQFAIRWSAANFAHPDLFIPIALVFAVLAGVAFWGIVEKPLTERLGRFNPRPSHAGRSRADNGIEHAACAQTSF
jgi:peptidoglycan/LPS O-acetylase OafA/YrhL